MAVEFIEIVYEGWSTLRRVTFSLSNGDRVTRHVEDHGASVCVLPYDPVRRRALLLRMVRAPVLMAGEEPVLEVPAGRRDETDPEAAVRREAMEELGVRLGRLERVMHAWTMPAVSSERSVMYLAEYTSADRIAPGGGLVEEGEEVEPIEISLDDLWSLCEQGELPDLKTAFLLYALRLRRPELFLEV